MSGDHCSALSYFPSSASENNLTKLFTLLWNIVWFHQIGSLVTRTPQFISFHIWWRFFLMVFGIPNLHWALCYATLTWYTSWPWLFLPLQTASNAWSTRGSSYHLFISSLYFPLTNIASLLVELSILGFHILFKIPTNLCLPLKTVILMGIILVA